MGVTADDVRPNRDCLEPFRARPFFGVPHQELSDPGATLALVDHEPADFRARVDLNQVAGAGVNPANHAPALELGHEDTMVVTPLDRPEAAFNLLRRGRVTELGGENRHPSSIA